MTVDPSRAVTSTCAYEDMHLLGSGIDHQHCQKRCFETSDWLPGSICSVLQHSASALSLGFYLKSPVLTVALLSVLNLSYKFGLHCTSAMPQVTEVPNAGTRPPSERTKIAEEPKTDAEKLEAPQPRQPTPPRNIHGITVFRSQSIC